MEVLRLMPVSKTKKLERYLNSPTCSFVGDKKNMVYHKLDCSEIQFINRNNLAACGSNPEGKGFKPCSICRPVPKVIKIEKRGTRAEVLREALSSLAERHGMHIRFSGVVAYVTTVVSEWFFNYTAEDIVLYHKNLEVRFNRDGNRIPGEFHTQSITFSSPMEVVSYIARHERVAEARLFCANAIQIVSRSAEDGSDRALLYIGDRVIGNGDLVTLLFPDGWHEVEIRFRNGKWYIANSEYNRFSLIGLFAISD